VILVLRKVFELTNVPVEKAEHSLSIDGSGLPTSIKQNWANDRENTEAHAGYDKL
jgi:hypothetical protein